jgi:hypothetical protein
MKEPNPSTMRVRDWDRAYENNRSRELGRTAWFPAPNDLGADWYAELVDHDDGAQHLGVWNALLMVASRATPRGRLARDDGRPHTAESLARVTRLPEQVMKAAIDRLLKMGLLEVGGNKPHKKSNLRSHPDAGKPQAHAIEPQQGAVEQKGTEHHHQERNGKEKKGTERAGDDRKTDRSSAGSSVSDFFQRSVDDEETPAEVYASPEDELKAIYLSKAGHSITIAVLDSIRLNLELNRVTMGDFVSGLKRQHLAGNWKNPPGFLRSLSKNFRAKNQPASEALTAAEAEEKNYQCQICSSRVRGEGALARDNKMVPCSCADPEWIARQRARGVFAEETAQW